MGKRGPSKTPTKILEKRGSWLAKTRVGEPRPELAAPDYPEWIDNQGDPEIRQIAREAWDRILPRLEDMGLLARCDEESISRYCVLLARWRVCETFIMQSGHHWTYIDKEGNKRYQMYPEVRVASELSSQLLRLEDRFGLNPSARSSIKVSEKPKGEVVDKSRFFKKGRS